jgi:PAS domain S-box-containing protein
MAEQKEQLIDNHILQSIMDLSFDAIIVTDTSDEITGWNGAAEKLFGRNAPEVIGKNIYGIIGHETLRNKDSGFSQDDGVAKHRIEYRRSDGTMIPILVIVSEVVDDQKAPVAYAYIVRDLREVASHEETIHEKNRAMDMFIYSVSHDLRAPLRRIVNYAEILQEDHQSGLNPEVQRVIERMAKNTSKMAELIDGLVSYSRLSQVTIQKTKVDMNTLADIVIDSQQKITNASNVRFVIEDLPEPTADLNLIKLVLTHLISNAIKFSQNSPEPVIEIGATETNDNINFYVKDNGVGFDMQYASKLFAIFQRLHNTAEFEGAGIGLAIVHQIISRHKGNVWADGNVNKGATFYFSLPK